MKDKMFLINAKTFVTDTHSNKFLAISVFNIIICMVGHNL